MQHFQSILIFIGVMAIGGVLIHGYLLSRKEKESATDPENIIENAINVDIFAEKSVTKVEPEFSRELPDDEVTKDVKVDAVDNTVIDFSDVLKEKTDAAARDNDELASQFQPTPVTHSTVEPFALNSDDLSIEKMLIEVESLVSEVTQTENAKLSKEMQQAIQTAEQEACVETVTEATVQEPDLFIFNVAAKPGEELGGHELLQFFLTSGFRFGEMSIFHRHEHSDGTGPILFSIANMMAPGIFEPEYMEQFKSEGVSFFLTAPNEHIDLKSSFDMMLRAVEQMAEEFDCDVLNAEREIMTTEQFIEYNQRLLHYI